MSQAMTRKKQPMVISLNIMDRMLMISLLILQVLLFIIFNLKMIHYVAYPLHTLFSSPSLVFSLNFEPHYLLNAFLYSLFFAQHVIMALISFKTTLFKFYSKYPLYQRYVYNIFSSWTYILILQYVEPVSLPNQIVFTSSFFINGPFLVIGVIILVKSVLTLGGDIFFPFKLSKILTSPDLTIYPDDAFVETGLTSQGIYGIVRHPMQLGVSILLLFTATQYTVDRIVFIFVHLCGIMLGLIFQERRLCKKFAGYPEYKKKVSAMLIPYIL